MSSHEKDTLALDSGLYMKAKSNQDLGHLPGPSRLPVIGHSLRFVSQPEAFEKEQWAKFKDVYRVNVFFRNSLALIGPDANQLLLLDRGNNFSSKMGWRDRLGVLFKDGLMLRDFADHRLHKQIMTKSFAPTAMRNYLKIMNETIEDSLQMWEGKPQLEFYSDFKEFTLNVAARAFVGIGLGPEADALNKAFIDTVAASVAFIRLPVPGLKFQRGLKGREFLVNYLSGLLPEKRSILSDDMFSQFCHAKSKEGNSFSDEDVINHMIFLLMAAHDTITSATTSLIYFLAKNPKWQDAVREEGRTLGSGPVGYDELEKLVVLEGNFNEALRLYPPVAWIIRRTLNEIEFKGNRIPPNTLVYISPLSTHRMEQYWSNPLEYDPSRFLDRNEHKQHPYVFVPFGGGAHMCIGKLFADMEVKAFVHQLLQKFEISLPDDYQWNPVIVPIPKPKNGLPIILKRIGK